MLSHIYLYIMKYLWHNLKYWASLYLSKAHLRTIWVTLTSPPYDYVYSLQIEKARLEEMIYYFENCGFAQHGEDIRWMKKCVKLLEIMIEEPITNTSVNIRNANRFGEFGNPAYFLYLKKASDLYYEIRKRHTDSWWD